MSLPVSQYEALLADVRGIRRKTLQVQQLARPFIPANAQHEKPLDYTMESLLSDRPRARSNGSVTSNPDQDVFSSRDKVVQSTSQMSVNSEPITRRISQSQAESIYRGAWPDIDKTSMWNSEPARLEETGTNQTSNNCQNDIASVMSFASSAGGIPIDRLLCSPEQKWSSQQLEAKMDVVTSLISMLGSQEQVDMGETLLALSTCPESCLAMRQSGCIPLLVQLVQSDKDSDTRKKAALALHNLVNSQPDEKIRKRELRILKLLNETRRYIECLKNDLEYSRMEASAGGASSSSAASPEEGADNHPVDTVAHLMKVSFDEGHRQSICQLGGIYTIAYLVECEHLKHGSSTEEGHCVLMRRYACMALTNLTFGDSGNKTLLCSFKNFMRALIVQLQSPSDELRQVSASVLRNLSWRADTSSRDTLREVGSVTGLMKAAMVPNKENTLKSILSALWNLSGHCTENRSEICAVEGGLGFLVDLLTYKTPTNSLAIIENAGGILRNVSRQIAVRDDYREILRRHNCLQILLDQLKSPSLTIVANACGTLWNLSAKNAEDQETLWQMGAPAMLRSLNHSKHKMIAMGSSAALRNLLGSRPQHHLAQKIDSTALALNLPELPTLGVRKQKALMRDLDQNLSETFERDAMEKESPLSSMGGSGCGGGGGGGLTGGGSSNTDIASFVQGKTRTRSRSPDELLGAFSSLTLEAITSSVGGSYGLDARRNARSVQNYGGSSLPYVPQATRHSNPGSFSPTKGNFSGQSYEDEPPEQPIDYSLKFSDADAEKTVSKKKSKAYLEKSNEGCNDYGYTETDLDQPTNYSLRYAEEESDMAKQEFVQDTVKTYCTEGTPYETPFNFSTATSMSDLRSVGMGNEKTEINNDREKDNDIKDNKEIKNVEEKDRCSTEDISEMENAPLKPPKSEFSSGIMSPEKPVNYCDEGTPGCFSRISSFGSGLDSIPTNDTSPIKKEEIVKSEAEGPSREEHASKIAKTPNEAKVVKFGQVVDYAEETPLMFSRSSSLASLDSIEQHSIHDDRSSVVSDFRTSSVRLTSGLVSPSELPDSPTQTLPNSPRASKQKLDFPTASKPEQQTRSATIDNGKSPRQSVAKGDSVFEDRVTKFKEESTPVQFSSATSLSSLTIDDNDDTEENTTDSATKTPETQDTVRTPPSGDGRFETAQHDQSEKKDSGKEKETSGSDDLNDDSDADDDILAACISDGMQSNISLPTAISVTSKLPASSFKYQPTKIPGTPSTGIPMMRRTPPRHAPFRNPPSIDDAPSRLLYNEDSAVKNTGSNSNIRNLQFPVVPKQATKGGDDSSSLSDDVAIAVFDDLISLSSAGSRNEFKGAVQRPRPSQFRREPNEAPVKVSQAYNSNCKIDKTSESGSRRETSLPPYLTTRDEIANYEVEDSPMHYSLRSSLSDLTVDSSVAGLRQSDRLQEGATKQRSDDVAGAGRVPHEPDPLREQRRSPFSSLSSLGSNEDDQALLDECIYSGMPTDSKEEALLNECIQAGMPASGSSRSSSRNMIGSGHSLAGDLPSNVLRPLQGDDFVGPKTPTKNCTKSKNVNVTSVVESIRSEQQGPEMSTGAAGVKDDLEMEQTVKASPQERHQCEEAKIGTQLPETDTSSPDRYSHSIEICLADQTRSGSSKSVSRFLEGSFENDFTYSNSDSCANLAVDRDTFTRSCEDSGNLPDNRMLDPDAMIESLDRFTAELVSQASSHLTKDKQQERSRTSTEEVTWNDDTASTFPTISGSGPNVITFGSEEDEADGAPDDHQDVDEVEEEEEFNNEPSSLNTTTMTESTLIAIEADKMATIFKQEAEMSQSGASLDLDMIRPPSQLNSLTNSVNGLIDKNAALKSPILGQRKKSLSGNLLVKRALSNSLNHSSGFESLDNNNSFTIDNVNPPSEMNNLTDLENSVNRSGPNFLLNEAINGGGNAADRQNEIHPIFHVKQQYDTHSGSLTTDLEMVNPPSILNEITDMCNSLADVPTDIIGTDTSGAFEDCLSNRWADRTVADTTTLQNDTSDYSDANSITPIQTDLSSAENTPKRNVKSINKNMMSKQRRNVARDRYKTYVVAAEKVMQESMEMELKEREDQQLSSPSDALHQSTSDPVIDQTLTYTVEDKPKLTPKDRRRLDPERFETRIVDGATLFQEATANADHDPTDSSTSIPATRSKLSIRRNFVQKRLENKERFKTQTLNESSFPSPEVSSASPPLEGDIQSLVEKEANLVLKTIRDSKLLHDEMLDNETLSLVSNDEDSEHHSGSPINYRTYHRSWSTRKPDIPIISNENDVQTIPTPPIEATKDCAKGEEDEEEAESIEEVKVTTKPKIVKPTETPCNEEENNDSDEQQPKGIRGRRKPLYSKTNLIGNKIAPKTIRPAKTMTSNLVKNVTSTIKSGASLKTVVRSRDEQTTAVKQPKTSQIRSSGYGYSRTPPVRSASGSQANSRTASPKHATKGTPPPPPPPLERQGTFTKDDSPANSSASKTPSRLPTPPSRIPSFGRQLGRGNAGSAPAKAPSGTQLSRLVVSNGQAKAVSADRSSVKNSRLYNRSTSADSREQPSKKIQPSSSTQSLKNDTKSSGATKKSGIPAPTQRSASSASIGSSTGSGNVAKKQVTSKIASLWKKVEESKAKQQQTSQDKRVWLHSEKPKLVRSDTFENKSATVVVAALGNGHEANAD